MNKCLLCKKEIEDGLWCNIEHKQKFLHRYYSQQQLEKGIKQFKLEEKKRQEFCKMLKEKGMTFSEYLRKQIKKDGLFGKNFFKDTVEIKTTDDDWEWNDKNIHYRTIKVGK